MGKVGVLLDRILDYLWNNGWGEISEFKRITGLEVEKVALLLDFLERFGFVSVDEESGRVELTDSSMEIVVPRIEKLEEASAPLRRVP